MLTLFGCDFTTVAMHEWNAIAFSVHRIIVDLNAFSESGQREPFSTQKRSLWKFGCGDPQQTPSETALVGC
jgi:hypothetical protein